MKIIVDTSISYYSIEKKKRKENFCVALFGQLSYCWKGDYTVCWKEATLSIYKVQLKFSKRFTMLKALRKPIVRKIGVALAI